VKLLRSGLFFSCLMASLVAGGADVANKWVQIGKDGENSLFLEGSQFERKGDAVTALIKVQYVGPQRMPFSEKQYDASERLYFFQCAAKKMILSRNNLLDGKTVVYSYDAQKPGLLGAAGAQSAQPVPPQGLEAKAFKFACEYKP
jgi:hypothetical protein